MSNESEDCVMLVDSGAVEARAANWLQRRQFWDWSEKDQADLDRWLAESPIHLVIRIL